LAFGCVNDDLVAAGSDSFLVPEPYTTTIPCLGCESTEGRSSLMHYLRRRAFCFSASHLCKPFKMSQAPWAVPTGPTHQPGLKVYNSLTRSKVPFVPLQPEHISWYSCGPTVYDDSHLGHARNYVTTDIIRRILRDYFHFQVRFVMNITDVDDKIILRARQRHLYDEYKKNHRYAQTGPTFFRREV
jgi:hypothetical protein